MKVLVTRALAVAVLGVLMVGDRVHVDHDGGIKLAGQAQAQPAQRPPARPEPAKPEPPAANQGAPAAQPGGDSWESFPTMLLERIYRGPLRDTIIQRWRDPIDGTVCFLYVPISAPLLPAQAQGYVQYGANQIGSVSCVHPTQVIELVQPAPTPAPAAAPQRR